MNNVFVGINKINIQIIRTPSAVHGDGSSLPSSSYRNLLPLSVIVKLTCVVLRSYCRCAAYTKKSVTQQLMIHFITASCMDRRPNCSSWFSQWNTDISILCKQFIAFVW
jgi:hypothetical protein